MVEVKEKIALFDSHKCKAGLTLLTEANEIDKYKHNPNAIGVLFGPCADWMEQTSNEHFYSERLWDLVVNSDYVKEALETKTLFGEIDHPDERLELKAEYAAINCTALWLDKQMGCVMGTFDILPTEKGKILKALCDYGSVLGVSSRGVGDLVYDSEKGNIVKEDSYIFVCFDVVVQPAAKKARQKYKSLTEQKKIEKSLNQTLTESILNCTNQSELDSVERLINNFNLIESFSSQIDDKRKVLKNNEADSIIKMNETLTRDLEQAYERIRILEGQTDSNNTLAELSFLRSQLSSIRDSVLKENQSLAKEVKKLSKILKSKEESSGLETRLNELTALNSNLNESLMESKNIISEQHQEILKLQRTVDYSVSFVNKCKKSFTALTEENNSLKGKNNSLAIKLKETHSSWEAEAEKSSNAIRAMENHKRLAQNLRMEYVQQKEVAYGTDLSRAMRKINEAVSLKDIDLIISENTSRTGFKGTSVLNAMTESKIQEEQFQDNVGETSVIREALRRNRMN